MRFRRPWAMGIVVCAVASVSLIGAPGASAQYDTTCPQQAACTWPYTNYLGFKTVWEPGGLYADKGWMYIGHNRSLKNHYGDRRVRFQFSDGPVGCANPGGVRPDRDFNFFNVGQTGSRC